jgi:hypothetical protein
LGGSCAPLESRQLAPGTSRVERIRVVLENSTSPGYAGKSFNTFDPKMQQ